MPNIDDQRPHSGLEPQLGGAHMAPPQKAPFLMISSHLAA